MGNARYDVIVVGGGHAGTEAALAAARAGSRTLLLTQSIETIGMMSCNPAIGGIGKSHLVRELDAVDGIMAKAADFAGIHFRVLNASKGPAVRATRAQADRARYRQFVRRALELQPGLSLFQQAVEDLLVSSGCVSGVVTSGGLTFYASAVVLTVGTFLGGKIHIGLNSMAGGRAGDPPANALSDRLRSLPFRVARLKTGTPPRIDGRTIDYTHLQKQAGDDPVPVMSFLGKAADHPRQVCCHITRTNERTHEIIRSGLDQSPMFTGVIEGTGPRYCPSIEDKVVRFAERDSHQIFIEPEGLDTDEVYPNGISTSLPYAVQQELVHSIAGFEHAHITRPGYAIEYDYLDPRDLYHSLESRLIEGLFLAGQINGTTGYEEAAGQGLVAGLNAANRIRGMDAWMPRRDEAYLGVMIDDLVTRGTSEPYRMFTSRAEYRLSLREDNADLRLTETGRRHGLVGEERWEKFCIKREKIAREQNRLDSLLVRPASTQAVQLSEYLPNQLIREHFASELLRRPELGYTDLVSIEGLGPGVDDTDVALQVEIQAKYAGYLQRQDVEIERQRRHEEQTMPSDFDYNAVRGLSSEVCEKLCDVRPRTLGQAARIPGVTPAAVSLLLVYIKKHQLARNSA